MKAKDFKKELLKNPEFKKEFEKFDLAFEISQMLIEARVIKGVTQERLAKMIGTKQSGIARAERGKYLPSLSFLQKIAKAFNSYLLPPRFAFMGKVNVEVDYKTNHTYGSYEKLINPGNIPYRDDTSSKNSFIFMQEM